MWSLKAVVSNYRCNSNYHDDEEVVLLSHVSNLQVTEQLTVTGSPYRTRTCLISDERQCSTNTERLGAHLNTFYFSAYCSLMRTHFQVIFKRILKLFKSLFQTGKHQYDFNRRKFQIK